MERIIKITERAATGKTKRASLKPGIYKEYNLDGKSLLVVVGEDGSWDCMPFELIKPFLDDELSPSEEQALKEISESEEGSQDVVPAWFALELVKALK